MLDEMTIRFSAAARSGAVRDVELVPDLVHSMMFG